MHITIFCKNKSNLVFEFLRLEWKGLSNFRIALEPNFLILILFSSMVAKLLVGNEVDRSVYHVIYLS